MSTGIIHTISKLAGLDIAGRPQRRNISDEQPTVADLVLPGRSFSDEFACLLKGLGRERESG